MFSSEYENAINAQFANNLRYFLEKNNYTQIDFAKKMNVSAATVSNWCNGTKSPRMDKVDIMCGIFKCRRSDLLEANPVSADDSLDLISTKKKVAKRFKKILGNISLTDLSMKSGVSSYTLNHYINGDIIPSEENAKKIGTVLDINHLWLMGFKTHMNSSELDDEATKILDMYQRLDPVGKIQVKERMQTLIDSGRTQQPDAYIEHADAIRQVREMEEARKRKNNIS